MNQESYIKVDESGYIKGFFIGKISASNSLINEPTFKIYKVNLSDDNILTKQEAIETIKEELKKINKNLT